MSDSATAQTNIQEAPFPQPLADLVEHCELEKDWMVYLDDGRRRGQGCSGLRLNILTQTFDTYHPEQGREYRVLHMFPVPAAAYDRRSWQRWLFDRYCDVVIHESCEWFKIDGERPYAPHHGDGEDPYVVWEVGEPGATKRRPGDTR